MLFCETNFEFRCGFAYAIANSIGLRICYPRAFSEEKIARGSGCRVKRVCQKKWQHSSISRDLFILIISTVSASRSTDSANEANRKSIHSSSWNHFTLISRGENEIKRVTFCFDSIVKRRRRCNGSVYSYGMRKTRGIFFFIRSSPRHDRRLRPLHALDKLSGKQTELKWAKRLGNPHARR